MKLVAMSTKAGTGGAGAAAGGASGSTSYSLYKKDDIPEFTGKCYADFPPFMREWKTLVAPGKSAEWQLSQLQKKTPDEIDLSSCATVDDAWTLFTNKYASPTLVSHETIMGFQNWKPDAKGEVSKLVQIEHKLKTMHRDLVAVAQGKQITENLFLLSAVIKMIPNKYQQDLVKLRTEKEETERYSMWKVLMEFLDLKRKEIEKYTPWDLDDKSEKKDDGKGKSCDICKSKQHLRKDCPKKAGATSLNIKDEKKFKEKQAEYGPCPMCKEGHSFRTKAGVDLASCRMYDCPKFKNLTAADKATQVEMAKGCAVCTSWKHAREDCNMPPRACGIEEDGVKCTLQHSRMLHGTRICYVNVAQRIVKGGALVKTRMTFAVTRGV